jgi:hypothetical protein
MSNTVYGSELVDSRAADLIAAAKAHRLTRLAKQARRANRFEKHITGHSDPSVPVSGDTTVL